MSDRGKAGQPSVRVLVVDDEPEIRRVLASLIGRSSSMKATVKECADGESAIALMEHEPFDIVISDFRMKAQSGIDVLERAADKFPSSGRILMTAHAELDIAVDAVNRGRVSGFVRKPWDSRQLITLVESLAPSPVTAPPAKAVPKPGPSLDEVQRKLDDVEHRLRQLRVRFGIGGISAEGFRQISEELRKERAQLEVELLGGRRA